MPPPDYCAALNLFEHRQFGAQALLHILGLVFPHKAVGFGGIQQAQECRPFFVGQAIEGADALGKFNSVSRFHCETL